MAFWDDIGDWVKNNAGGISGALIGGPAGFLVGRGLQGQAQDAKAAQSAYANRPDPYAGMPTAPTDVSSGVTRDTTGLDRFKQEAFRTGPSNWAKLSLEQQKQNANAARDRGTAEVGTQYAKGMDDLAMTGGLTGGARERLANSAGRNQLDMSQQVGKQQSDNELQIGINDEQNRISQLGQVPGMDLAAANFDLSKATGQNEFNARNYQTQGGIWAAGKQADAEDPRNPNSPNYDNGKRWYNPFSW